MSKITLKINSVNKVVNEANTFFNSSLKKRKSFNVWFVWQIKTTIESLNRLQSEIQLIPNKKLSKEDKDVIFGQINDVREKAKTFITEQLWLFEYDMIDKRLNWNDVLLDMFYSAINFFIQEGIIDKFPDEIKNKMLVIKLSV